MNAHQILIVDDDDEDLGIFQQAFAELGFTNQVFSFNDSDAFLEFLRQTTDCTFFILCDVNMPKRNGLELRKIIFEDKRLRLQCIPFIFLSTSNAPGTVMQAYSYGVQGYFVKPTTMEKMKTLLLNTMNYWNSSLVPIYN